MRHLLALIIALLLAFPAQAASLPPFPPNTNGCSGGVSKFWRNVTHRVPVWEFCCYDHDYAYRAGGGWTAKARADYNLGVCISRYDPFAGSVIYATVALVGQIFWNYKGR